MHYLLLVAALAAPICAAPTDYPAPAGGWESVDYPAGTGENLEHYPAPPGGWEAVDYPDGTGANLDHYPPPPGGWESVDYSGGTEGSKTECPPPPEAPPAIPMAFTSTYRIVATPGAVVNGTPPAYTGGLPGCTGYFDLGINTELDLICWNITLTAFEGDYSSPARTATHVHQANAGLSGPPRIVFPDPVGDGHVKTSVGCQQGPFTTGVVSNGSDSGAGFDLHAIEDNPGNFYVDVHSSLAVPGAVRGQFA